MILYTLKLSQFKNYEEENLEFSGGINLILGKNGMGKTNLLDAIHYLSMTRSAFNTIDQQNITHGKQYFSVIGEFLSDKKISVVCYYEQGRKKVFKVNGLEPEKLSDHIGNIPSVLTTPDDNELIREGSETRRKLFDGAICQYNPDYLKDLIELQKTLKQRNSFLKQNEGNPKINHTLLDVYDEKLIPLNVRISQVRQAFIDAFTPYFKENYRTIFSGGEETPDITYLTDCLDEHFSSLFKRAREKDLILQRTTVGSHKDDYLFELNKVPVKKFGSQGQQKSFIIALKLAEFDFLKSVKKTDPLLLLDDLFDKLDDERIRHLVTLLADQKRFSQVFITDARTESSRAFFKEVKVRSFLVKEGKIV